MKHLSELFVSPALCFSNTLFGCCYHLYKTHTLSHTFSHKGYIVGLFVQTTHGADGATEHGFAPLFPICEK